MNYSFQYALEARFHWMQMRCLQAIGGFETEAEEHRQQALLMAMVLADAEAYQACLPRRYGEQPPLLFADVPELSEQYLKEYAVELANWEAEEAESARRNRQIERQAHARECIAREAWHELDMPSPREMVEALLRGESVDVENHYLHYDAADNVTWMDNPYGVPGALGQRPTEVMARSFLSRVALGGMFGPEP